MLVMYKSKTCRLVVYLSVVQVELLSLSVVFSYASVGIFVLRGNVSHVHVDIDIEYICTYT